MDIKKESNKLLEIILPIFSQYSDKYKIDDIYDFDINREIYKKNGLFTDKEQLKLNNSKNLFEENVLLKKIVSFKLISEKDPLKYYNWIVKDWGRITVFDKKIDVINDFFKQIGTNKLGSKHYCTISSLSKIAAFKFPERYFIYDSRVAYSLDWILIKSKKDTSYFFVPNGRNTFLEKYNMNNIISLFSGRYYEKKYTYAIYNELIENIFNNANQFRDACNVEMFLWSLFEKIKPEIKNSVKISD